MVANFLPGNPHSGNNILQFLESTLHHLGDKVIGLLRPDSGFFDETIFRGLEDKRIPYIITARLTQPAPTYALSSLRLVGIRSRLGTDGIVLPGRRD